VVSTCGECGGTDTFVCCSIVDVALLAVFTREGSGTYVTMKESAGYTGGAIENLPLSTSGAKSGRHQHQIISALEAV
jgi:hypothetical protein